VVVLGHDAGSGLGALPFTAAARLAKPAFGETGPWRIALLFCRRFVDIAVP
jgi:hypothetical protein